MRRIRKRHNCTEAGTVEVNAERIGYDERAL
jgi:hypothetical protein